MKKSLELPDGFQTDDFSLQDEQNNAAGEDLQGCYMLQCSLDATP